MCNENKCEGGVCKLEMGGHDEKGGCGHHHKHMMKWLIKIIVLVVLLCGAFQMGELKGMLRGQYGHMNRGFYGGYGGGMMYNNAWGDIQPLYGTDGAGPASTNPVTPAK